MSKRELLQLKGSRDKKVKLNYIRQGKYIWILKIVKIQILKMMYSKYMSINLQSGILIDIPALCSSTRKFSALCHLASKNFQNKHIMIQKMYKEVFCCCCYTEEIWSVFQSLNSIWFFCLFVCLQHTNMLSCNKFIMTGCVVCSKHCWSQLLYSLHWQLEAKALRMCNQNVRVLRQKTCHKSMTKENEWYRKT